jgi:hypothetical protein
MPLATFNSSVRKGLEGNPKPEGRRPKEGRSPKPEARKHLRLIRISDFDLLSAFGLRPPGLISVFAALCLLALGPPARGGDSDDSTGPRKAFEEAKRKHESNLKDVEATWQFARATFDLADVATGKSERAEIAQQGIAACNQALEKTTPPDCAALHYYLGLNQGELARTKVFGALRLVDQMEREFLKAIELDASFDYGGPDRSVGLLYRDAPAFGSIGSRTKARTHLEHAVELAPCYPENRLNLIESELKWNDRKSARHELKLLEDSWPDARAQFTGSAWGSSWTDWNSRLDKIKRTLEEPARLESPRH